MKCINCYKEIKDGLKFCTFCGTKQPADRAAYEREHPELAEALPEDEIMKQIEDAKSNGGKPVASKPASKKDGGKMGGGKKDGKKAHGGSGMTSGAPSLPKQPSTIAAGPLPGVPDMATPDLPDLPTGAPQDEPVMGSSRLGPLDDPSSEPSEEDIRNTKLAKIFTYVIGVLVVAIIVFLILIFA